MGKPKAEPRASWVDDETFDAKKKRASLILRRLEKQYPDTRTALNYTTPFELLVATVLSAQSTDKMVNIITEKLFPRDKWFKVSHLLIDHGRNVCFARNPNCAECAVNELCPAARVPAVRKKA